MSSGSPRSTAVVDLDGVVWLAGEPLPGVGRAVALLVDAGYDVIFATNNSSPTISELRARLARAEIDAGEGSVVTAAQAAAICVPEGSSVMIIGEQGLHEAAANRNLRESDEARTVLVGWNREFTFDTVADAATAIRSGAAFVATNDDPTHPTPKGLLPGTGALVAAIATAAETAPLIAGKPGEAMVRLVTERSGPIAVVIGDRPSTDGAFARQLGAPFGLVASEATPSSTNDADYRANSLLGVVEEYLRSERR